MPINTNKPITINGQPSKVVHVFPGGNFSATYDNISRVLNFYPDGSCMEQAFSSTIVRNVPESTRYTLDIYPTSRLTYRRDGHRDAPCESVHDDMFSVLVTEQDGVIISREIVR